MMIFLLTAQPAYAATSDPIQAVNNLTDFVFLFVRSIGILMSLFGIIQFGLSFKSHDPSQRAQGLMVLAGGLIVVFAKEILMLVTG